MDLNEAVSRRILELCKKKKITVNKLASISYLTQSTVNSIVNKEIKSPNLKTILMICNGFGIELPDFFNTELFTDIKINI